MKLFWPTAAALLAVMGAVQVLSVRTESQTWDEALTLAAAYSYWKTGDFRMNPETPPLGKYVDALPLLFLNPHLPLEHPSWKERDEVGFGREFLYHNTLSADTLLLAGRLMSVAVTLVLGLSLALWTRRHFGAPVALFALALFAFDPNLIAHGRYVTSDIFVTVAFFLACIAWTEYLLGDRKLWLALAGVGLGLGLASKHTALLLLPIFVLLYGLRWWQRRPASGAPHALGAFAAAGLIAYATLVALYAPEARFLMPGMRLIDRSLPPARATIQGPSTTAKVLIWATSRLAMPRSSYLDGLSIVARHDALGHPAYLLGRRSEQGWWWYYPVVLAVKTPSGLLAGLALAIGLLISRLAKTRWREVPLVWYALAIPPVLFFAVCMTSRINLGVRYLLPIYPFLCVAIAAALWNRGWRVILGLVTALVAIESAAIYPYYLAFFNLPSGGPNRGAHYLVDSNLDWGQDVRRLKAYLTAHGERGACVTYFGNAQLPYYGIHEDYVPNTAEVRQGAAMNCLAAVSATQLMGTYSGDSYAWLRDKTPVAKIGYSIFIYDFRKPPGLSPVPAK